MAEVVSPYQSAYTPKIGEFIAAELTQASAIVGRITFFCPIGAKPDGSGSGRADEHNPRAGLRYSLRIKLLGGVETAKGGFVFRVGAREIPHSGATVGTLRPEVLRFICSLGKQGKDAIPIGHYTLGEKALLGDDGRTEVPVLFDLDALAARKTYVFARAGYGKSNLVKLLVARLYEKEHAGGLLIFDPEGEYAFRDKYGRPGLADVPHLREKLVVYTNRRLQPPNSRWVAGDVRINLRDMRPSEVVNQCLPEGKQELVFANVLRGLDANQWRQLVDLIKEHGYRAPDATVADLAGLSDEPGKNAAVIGAIKNNLTPVVNALHSVDSPLMREVRSHLAMGRIVVVDISLLSSADGYRIAGLVLNELFHRNQENCVAGTDGDVVPVIAVLEEAQAILPRGVPETSPFLSWVKEGRKYGLGSILVTQQPGAVDPALISQGDNFFVFHLLNGGDLSNMQTLNAHYSDDILRLILSESIKGNAYIWSAPDQPFVLPCRIQNYEEWVASLPDSKAEIVTPAESEKTAVAEIEGQLDAAIKREIASNSAIAIYPAEVGGENGLGAIKIWNLLFALGEALEADKDLTSRYGRVLRNGKRHLAESACLESLARLGLYIGSGKSGRDKYFVVRPASCGRMPRGEVARFDGLLGG